MQRTNISVDDLQALLTGISDGIAMLSNEGVVTWTNEPFRQFATKVGLRPDSDIFEFFRTHAEFDLRECIKASRDVKGTSHHELFCPGLQQWFFLHISVFEFGVTIRFEDVTAQKLELQIDGEQVMIDERNLRILINITDHPIWLVDTNCTILLCNSAFKKWGYDFSGRDLNPGDNVLDKTLDPIYLSKLAACYELALTGKNFTAIEDIRVGAELRFTTINFNPVFDKNNNIIAISCHATDITDHKKNLSKIETQTQLLMEIANIQSHKVRGPVATLLGLVHIFNFEDLSDPANSEVMSGVSDIASRLDQIVTDVIRSINLLSYKSGKQKE